MSRRILVVGGSRGIGLAVAAHLEAMGDRLWCVPRTRSPHGEWIEADLAGNAGVESVIARMAGDVLDALLYLGGTWEAGAFTDEYAFARSPRAEIDRVLAVNLVAPIGLVHGLLAPLRRARNPRVVLIGALSGLENRASREVANSASKYGLRGAAQALRIEAPDVPVTVINPGNVATPEVEDDIAAGRFAAQTPIPLADLLATIDFILSLSRATSAIEINLAQTDLAAA